MNGEWRGRCLFKGLLPGFGEGVELNGVTAAPTSACLGLKGGREAAISSDKLQTSQPLAMKGALGSADKSRCVSCLSALIGLGFVCRPVSARLETSPGRNAKAAQGCAERRPPGVPPFRPHTAWRRAGQAWGGRAGVPPPLFAVDLVSSVPLFAAGTRIRQEAGLCAHHPGVLSCCVSPSMVPRAPLPRFFVLPLKTLLPHSPTARAAGSCSCSQPPRVLAVGSGHRVRVNGPPLSPSWWASRRASSAITGVAGAGRAGAQRRLVPPSGTVVRRPPRG